MSINWGRLGDTDEYFWETPDEKGNNKNRDRTSLKVLLAEQIRETVHV